MQDRLRTDVTAAVLSVDGVTDIELSFGFMTEEQRNNVKKIVRNGREKFIPFAEPDSITRVIGIASGKGACSTADLGVGSASSHSPKRERDRPGA